MKCLYIHRRKSDLTPFYIGVGISSRPYNFSNRNEIWKSEYIKHDCVVDILHFSSDVDFLFKKEKELIFEYGRILDGTGILSNISTGGKGGIGCKMSESNKEKIRLRMTGKKMSEETKAKLSKSKTGKSIPIEVRNKMSESHKKRDYFHSGFGKKILDIETGILYGNIRLACEALNLNMNSIQKKIVRNKYNRLRYEQAN